MSQEPSGVPAGREAARALTRASLALRLGIETHKRSISAHRRTLGAQKAALNAVEQECEALGIDLVLDENAEPKGGHSR